MLIAITATGDSLQSEVDPRFGRAAYYMIVDTESGDVKAHDNSDGINASNGAGTGAAQTLSELGVEALYTGRVGPKAADVLNQAKIPYYENISGTVEEVLSRIDQGEASQSPSQVNNIAQASSQLPGLKPGIPGSGRGSGMGMGAGRGMGMGRGMGSGRGRGMGMGRGACQTQQVPAEPLRQTVPPAGKKPPVQPSRYRLVK
ncbi:MAG: NifB/NifX family molybdenum-iron cluster-binding protein [Desulfuromonadales bacterium]|nr:NifB/NifX family molybdenum-iron cluster-binding protein [Desulfuromonadales bacterium]MBN2792435.1 NifB/NifX family molybdenum-iron cluster-binding protein [Desulfuromonadales bacterium]